MTGEDKDSNPLDISDEDFAKLSPSSFGSDEEASASSSVSGEGDGAKEDETVAGGNDDDAAAAGTDGDTPAGDVDADAKAKADAAAAEQAAKEKADLEAEIPDEELAKAQPPVVEKPGKDKPAADGKPVVADPAVKETSNTGKDTPVAALSSKTMKPEELASFFDEVMTPFKANGKDITLRSPKEAIRLMQMGAGYGRKLQEMQPHLKTLRMLEKNDLLDENKLSYLIDLNAKNPEAIKKLIKDAGIDPLDLNLEDNNNYRPTNHGVSDDEVAFDEALKSVAGQDKGRETIQHINTAWDEKSKEFLWANPSVLEAVHSQRQNGVYAKVTAEIERMTMLGDIKPGTPFLEAYKIAGDALTSVNSLSQPGSKTVTQIVAPASTGQVDQPGRVLGTRTAAPKSQAANNDKASAAASPKSSTRKAKESVNPLEMADDEFLKQFSGRL